MVSVTGPEPTPFSEYLGGVIDRSMGVPPNGTFCHLIGFTEAIDAIVAVKVTSDPYLALPRGVVKVTEMEPVKIDF